MFIAFDIVTVCILASVLVYGYKKGIGESLLRLVSTLVTLFGSIALSSAMAQPIYDSFFRQTVYNSISGAIEKSSDVLSFSDNISGFLSVIVGMTGSAEKVFESAQKDISLAIESYISPTLITLIKLLLFVLLLIAISLLLKPVVKILSGVFKLPLIGALNRLAGVLTAIPVAIIIVSVLIGIFVSMSKHMSGMNELFSPDNINNTFLFRYFYTNGIVSFVCRLFG